VDRLFLDANVLFSAAYNPTSPLLVLWELKKALLFSSSYAVHEARKNLAVLRPDRVDILETLIAKLFLVDSPPGAPAPPEAASLPAKDVPILLAAMEAGASHLLTVDKKHFGLLYGQAVARTLVLTPGAYLRSLRNT
jgi:predicted nucleic acid-binding protein